MCVCVCECVRACVEYPVAGMVMGAVYLRGSQAREALTGMNAEMLAASMLLMGSGNGCTGPASTAGGPDPLSWVSRVT